MSAEGVEAVRVGGGDQRLIITSCDFGGATVWIQRPEVEMAELNCVKAIDFPQQARPDRSAQDIKWMRRDRENGVSTRRSQGADVCEGSEPAHLGRGDIEEDDIGSFDSHFSRWNEQDAHCGCVSKDLGPIENSVVQGNRQYAEAECTRPLKQLVRGIINDVFGVVD